MKKLRLLAVVVLLVALLGGCTFFSSLFGPSKNNILGWVAGIVDGARYSYQERVSSTDPDYYLDGRTYDYVVEVVDVEARETKTIIRTLFDGDNHYLIADDARGQLLSSQNDIVGDDDQILLETPVEEGNTWVGPLDSYVLLWVISGTVADVRFTIDRLTLQRSFFGRQRNEEMVDFSRALS